MVTSEQARELLSQHGVCLEQSPSDWTGSVALPEDLEQFYIEVGPRNIEIVGYGNPTFIPSLAELQPYQPGPTRASWTSTRKRGVVGCSIPKRG